MNMRPDVLELAHHVAASHALALDELLLSRVHESMRARHEWRGLVASSLGYGYPGGASLSELARLLGCDRDAVRASLSACGLHVAPSRMRRHATTGPGLRRNDTAGRS